MNILRQTEKMGIKRFALVSSLATVASPDDRTSLVWTDKGQLPWTYNLHPTIHDGVVRLD